MALINIQTLEALQKLIDAGSFTAPELEASAENHGGNDKAEIVTPAAAASPLSMEFSKELFLQEVRGYRCLWNTNSDSYKN